MIFVEKQKEFRIFWYIKKVKIMKRIKEIIKHPITMISFGAFLEMFGNDMGFVFMIIGFIDFID